MNPEGWADPEAREARRRLGSAWEGVEVAAVLGSGLAGALLGNPPGPTVPFEAVPGLGACTVPGHPGRLRRCAVGGRATALFLGRRHLYEGVTPAGAAFPVRLGALLGARLAVLLSAVGGVAEEAVVGTWVLVEDHLNLTGCNPLEGVRTDAGPAFVDLTRTYRADLFEALAERLRPRGIPLSRGVLAAFAGPTYETPAEVRMARLLGAATVGMSTVPEAVWARFLGLDVVALGLVVNPAAGLGAGALDHREVVRRSGEGAAQAAAVLEEAVRAWAAAPRP
ncbi:MAG: purine-nucleoside phosphorylase, partial [Deferrisomatales bacterium]|nr:purine-nucleoside phosphorylase [Deferrisomatales bacterium]